LEHLTCIIYTGAPYLLIFTTATYPDIHYPGRISWTPWNVLYGKSVGVIKTELY